MDSASVGAWRHGMDVLNGQSCNSTTFEKVKKSRLWGSGTSSSRAATRTAHYFPTLLPTSHAQEAKYRFPLVWLTSPSTS